MPIKNLLLISKLLCYIRPYLEHQNLHIRCLPISRYCWMRNEYQGLWELLRHQSHPNLDRLPFCVPGCQLPPKPLLMRPQEVDDVVWCGPASPERHRNKLGCCCSAAIWYWHVKKNHRPSKELHKEQLPQQTLIGVTVCRYSVCHVDWSASNLMTYWWGLWNSTRGDWWQNNQFWAL